MTAINHLKNKLYQEFNIPSSLTRRQILVDEMASLEGLNIHCFNCPGTCCTFSANSMQITPLEAFEILFSLNLTASTALSLKERMQESITHYRLDHDISTGKKFQKSMRRTYTCPFFSPGPKGCTLSRASKPYGCLGFNPKISDDNGSSCHSGIEVLEKRENDHASAEREANLYLKENYSLYWDKIDLPRALFAILSHPSAQELFL